MKIMFCVSVLGAVLIGSASAMAATAYMGDDAAINAGPGSAYPVLNRLSKDTRVWVNGCQQALDWCDVSHGRLRGWVSANRLVREIGGQNIQLIAARSDLPVVNFNIDRYWLENYKNRDFYRNLAQWRVQSREFAANSQSDRIGIAQLADGQ